MGQEGVEKRIDVIATIMRNNGCVQDLLDSELCYAPPFNSAKDPVNILGMCADNVLKGLLKPAFVEDLKEAFLVDVRVPDSFKIKTIEDSINIPLAELRNRLQEIPTDKKVVLICDSGYTSYVASRILLQSGYSEVYSLMGGMKLYKAMAKDKEGMVTLKAEGSKKKEAKVSESESLFIDATGLQCPGPIMKLAEKIKELKDGEIIKIASTDKGFTADVEAWCRSTGNTLLSLNNENQQIIAMVKRGGALIHSKNDKNAQTIVVFSNDLDKAMAAFIIANGAKASGKDVTLFFTFWGLNILRKDTAQKFEKSPIDKIFGFMMPKGSDGLTLSKMNMGGLGTMMMKHVMKSKNVSSLKELIEEAQKQGIKFIACQMSMDVMGIKQEELIDGVEIGGVAKYIAESNNANSNLFI